MKAKAKSGEKVKAKAKRSQTSKIKRPGSKTLTVSSQSKIHELEELVGSGNITVILVYAEWCGACHKFRKDIWDPMSKGNALHNRIAVRDDMIRKTSLSNAKFDYLPSILVVDEKGDVQTFKTPEGKVTNAMPTPKSLEDMTRVVNVPVKPALSNESNNQVTENPTNYNYTNVIRTTPTITPKGTTYIPVQGGGSEGNLFNILNKYAVGSKVLKIGRQTRKIK